MRPFSLEKSHEGIRAHGKCPAEVPVIFLCSMGASGLPVLKLPCLPVPNGKPDVLSYHLLAQIRFLIASQEEIIHNGGSAGTFSRFVGGLDS